MIKSASLALLASASLLAIDLSSAKAQTYQVGGQTYQVEGRPSQGDMQPPVAQRVAYSERQYGGGLIEMLFNGGQPLPQPYAPQPQPRYDVEPRYELRRQQILPPMGAEQGYQREPSGPARSCDRAGASRCRSEIRQAGREL